MTVGCQPLQCVMYFITEKFSRDAPGVLYDYILDLGQ